MRRFHSIPVVRAECEMLLLPTKTTPKTRDALHHLESILSGAKAQPIPPPKPPPFDDGDAVQRTFIDVTEMYM